MTCDEANGLLDAEADGARLCPTDAARLAHHLGTCASCAALTQETARQDAALRKAFARQRARADAVADRVVAQLPPTRQRRIVLRWLPLLASAAAGFAIAWGVFRATPTNVTRVPTTVVSATRPNVARLTLATGAVEVADATTNAWSSLPTGGAIDAGAHLRTGAGVRCEFTCPDASQIRLDQNSEVVLRSARRFDLIGGRAWSSVAHDSAHPFQALAAAVTFTALGTQFDLETSPDHAGATLTVVEGSVKAEGNASSAVVASGEQLSCTSGHLGDKAPARDLALATRWVNEILVMKGRDDPELSRRIDDLFAQIGDTKMSGLYEDEVRALGDHCVVPLTRYIESDRSNDHPAKRAAAARIVADVAPPWAIPELLPLLHDADGDVRAAAAAALARLTGQSLGRSTEQWRQESVFQCAPSADAWGTWWERNKARYPGAEIRNGKSENRGKS